jgi:hypothetical protein
VGTPLSPVTPQLRYNSAWNPVPCYADDMPTVIERGYTDEGTIKPSRMSMRINDSAAPTLNPSRPNSPLYGVTGRSMPAAITCGGTTRAWLETAVLDPDQDQAYSEASYSTASPRGKRWIDLEAYGPLYRIGQWSDLVQAPMTRTFLSYSNLIGFWPGDDAGLSTQVGNGGSFSNVTAGDASAPAGASGSFVGQAGSHMVLSPLTNSDTAGFQVFWSTDLSAVPVSPATTQFLYFRANPSLIWSVELDNVAFHLKLYSAGTLVDDSNISLAGVTTNFTDWVTWRAKCYQSGADVKCEFAWYSKSDNLIWGFTRTYVGLTLNRLTSIRMEGNTLTNGTRYAQIGALTSVADDLQSYTAIASFNGYAGESTTTRFNRLMTEAGISRVVIGTSTTLMGPQKADTLMNLLKEIAATEDGLLFDQKDNPRTVLRTRRSRVNQAVGLTLDANVDIVPPFKERVDNVGVANVVTITDRSGYTGTVTKTTGSMAATAYPAGIGTFKGGALPDVKVNLNSAVDDMPAMLAWYLARGTVPGPRWPTVTIEVGQRSPGLAAAAKALEIGDRLQITNRMADPIDLQIIGIRERIGIFAWEFTFTCIPNAVFDAGAEDDTTHALDTYANTIITAPAPATTGTSMVVGSADPDDVWSATSLPYPIMVAGEKMTVTAATAPTLVSGTWRQTLTVTRSVNGIVKAQVVGTPVNVFAPYREAW